MDEDEITAVLAESDDEDVFSDIQDLPIQSDSSSDDSNSSDEEENDPPSSKKQKLDSRKWVQNDFVPTLHDFDSRHSGMRSDINLDENASELDFFELFFTNSIMQSIVTETNKYASTLALNLSLNSKMKKWIVTTVK